jgi:hypothetical protein
MSDWKDITSYSRGDKERIPTIFSLNAGNFRIVIMNSHIYYKGLWVLDAAPFFNLVQLKAKTKEEAQEEAVHIVRKELKRSLRSLHFDSELRDINLQR